MLVYCAPHDGAAHDVHLAMPEARAALAYLSITMTRLGARRRMAQERRGAGSSVVSIETLYYKTIY